jgi:hypothetical protein
MIAFQLITLLPAAAVIAVGSRMLTSWKGESDTARPSLFLLTALALLLLLTLLLHPTGLDFLAIPATIGILAGLLVLLRLDLRAWRAESIKRYAPYIVLNALLLVLVQILLPPAALLIIIPAVVVALTWRAWEWRGIAKMAAILFWLLMLAAGIDLIPSVVLNRMPPWTGMTFPTLSGLWTLVAVVLIGRLVLSIQPGRTILNLVSAAWRLALAALLVLSISYLIVSYLAWDVITDGLGGVMVAMLVGWAAVAAAMLWAWRPENDSRGIAAALAFAAGVLVLVQVPLFGGLRVDPVQMTAERASRVNEAVLRYHVENGRYPSALADLSPWYLWRIAEPIAVRNLTWCYEAGPDYYRLGYVHVPAFGFRGTVRLQASAGDVPNSPWQCDEELARYNASPYLHD